MRQLFGKGSRLILIFILTVLVSGSIFTYLSISQISNYKELLEKKISEEERDLTKRFASDFQHKLDSLTLNFYNSILNSTSQKLINPKSFDNEFGHINYVVMDSTGSYLIPNFINSDKSLYRSKASTLFTDKLRKAENTEFRLNDYKRAVSLYLQTLKVAKTTVDSAQVYNSLGRLFVKMNDRQKAFETYQAMLLIFSSTLNSSGFPYAYFSIVKLLKMSDSSNIESVQKLLDSFLKGLTNGTIPLNESSEEILDLVNVWQHKFSASIENKQFENLIEINRNSLLLIKNYKSPIKNIINDESIEYTSNQPIDYVVIKPASGDSKEIMLFYKKEKNSGGFTIGVKQLFAMTLQDRQLHNLKFEYTIKLVEKTANNLLLNTNRLTLTEFSTLFENCLIQVALKNENTIKEAVVKRKIAYGIGLFLFLGITIFGLYLLIQDIKREKKIHKLRADFVSNVTHELKTPLTSINMFAEALNMNKESLDGRQLKYTNIIVKESEKLKRMINNILEFSKKENNKLSYNLETSNLTAIVNSTLQEMGYFFEINNFAVHATIENNIFAKVYPEGIKLALTNLISNALKYSSLNKKMNIRLFKEASKIYIEVEDFGIGIQKDKLELIFEKFYRVNSSDNETTSGTGLGLTVTKDIIEEQDGELWVESTLGKGSTFTIVLNTI